jgi:hypothetical protein
MLLAPLGGHQALEDNVGTTSAEFGTTVTASGTAHTKGSYSQLVASTTYEAFGISILLAGLQTAASTNTRCLVDIGIGAAASEVVLIPDLMCGNVAQEAAASGMGAMYHFPLYIPAGSRLAARSQALVVSDTCTVALWLHEWPLGAPEWVGSRVTAYGANTATSSGVNHSPGNSAYAAATQIVASTTNPIRAMQIGYGLATDTTGDTCRGLVRIGLGATPNYLVSDLPFKESTTIEAVDFNHANFILSQKRFDLPAGSDLRLSAMRNATAAARGWIIYGVD